MKTGDSLENLFCDTSAFGISAIIARELRGKYGGISGLFTVRYSQMICSILDCIKKSAQCGYYSLEVTNKHKKDIEGILKGQFLTQSIELLGIGSHSISFKVTINDSEYVVKFHHPGRCIYVLYSKDGTMMQQDFVDSRESFQKVMLRILHAVSELQEKLKEFSVEIAKPIYASNGIMIIPYRPGTTVDAYQLHDLPIIKSDFERIEKAQNKKVSGFSFLTRSGREVKNSQKRFNTQIRLRTVSYRIFECEQIFRKYNSLQFPEIMDEAQFDMSHSNFFITDDGIILLIDPFALKGEGDMISQKGEG